MQTDVVAAVKAANSYPGTNSLNGKASVESELAQQKAKTYVRLNSGLSLDISIHVNPLTPTVAICVQHIKHPMPDWVKPSFVIFGIRAL